MPRKERSSRGHAKPSGSRRPDQPSAFERLIESVPAVLESLPDEAQHRVAATSWACLLALLQHTCHTIDLHWNEVAPGGTLAGLAQRLERRSVPVPGSLRIGIIHRDSLGNPRDHGGPPYEGHSHACFAADDAAALLEAFRDLQDAGTRHLRKLMSNADMMNSPLRVRGLYDWSFSPDATKPGSRTIMGVLQRPAVQEQLRDLRVRHFALAGGGCKALSRCLAGASNLHTLHFWDHKMSTAGVVALAGSLRGLRHLRTFKIRSPGSIRAAGVVALMEMLEGSPIEDFTMDGHDDVGPEGCAAVERMLKNTSTLRRLLLSMARHGTSLDGIVVGPPSTCKGLGGALGAGLASNATVKEIHLEFEPLGGEDGTAFARGLETNRTLETLLLENSALGDASVEALGQALGEGCPVKDLALIYNAFGAGGSGFARGVSSSSHLVQLEIAGAPDFGDDELAALAHELETGAVGQVLQQLSLCDTNTGPEGVAELSAALLGNTTLRVLKLCENPLGDEGVSELVGNGFLRFNRTLEVLVLRDVGMSDEGIMWLGTGLAGNVTLRELHVPCNYITASGLDRLVASWFIREPSIQIEELYLGYQGEAEQVPDKNDEIVRCIYEAVSRFGWPLRVLGMQRWRGLRMWTLRRMRAWGCEVLTGEDEDEE
ncbi:unnamed protein product [Pedinophyceae sp. YPF-701]|nr:unnamed protein product [Pedinophyceae sp. YPF-701]